MGASLAALKNSQLTSGKIPRISGDRTLVWTFDPYLSVGFQPQEPSTPATRPLQLKGRQRTVVSRPVSLLKTETMFVH